MCHQSIHSGVAICHGGHSVPTNNGKQHHLWWNYFYANHLCIWQWTASWHITIASIFPVHKLCLEILALLLHWRYANQWRQCGHLLGRVCWAGDWWPNCGSTAVYTAQVAAAAAADMGLLPHTSLAANTTTTANLCTLDKWDVWIATAARLYMSTCTLFWWQ